jgi:hypothetical protein
MQEIKLLYGLRDGELVHISKVEQGLACECICPSCKAQLIARKGDVNTHHFAHYSLNDCERAVETSLHLLAKKILKETHSIRLPAITLDFGYNDWVTNCGTTGQCTQPFILYKENIYAIDNVLLEQRIETIIPDVIVYIKNKPLLLEIYVTHKVDSEKLQKIQSLDLATIEIDLSSYDSDFNEQVLKKILGETTDDKYWIYNKKLNQGKSKFSKAIDIQKTIRGDFETLVNNCPKKSNTYTTVDNCCDCEYCLDVLTNYGRENVVVCGGRNKIKTLEELRLLCMGIDGSEQGA